MREAAKESKELDVSSDGEKVRRTRPLPEVDDSAPRTIYVEGIGEHSTMEEVQEAMSAYGKVRPPWKLIFIVNTESHLSCLCHARASIPKK
jgi:hypothetical protein